ncbi:hypothetical protein GEMRC1_007185 [Eukaryota sp. GEM-RC1]
MKLLRTTPTGSDFSDDTPYVIMFGPDVCGSSKVHFVFTSLNPITNKYEEHHLVNPPSVQNDGFTHLYTLIVDPKTNDFQIKIDGKIASSGSLLTSFEPPVNPPKQIPDPKVQKPNNWDQPEFIPDPDAVKPDDWNEDAEWIPPMVLNPDYKGKFEATLIDNPNYFQLSQPLKKMKVEAIGMEVWTLDEDILIDNVLLTHDETVAMSLAKETFHVKQANEVEETTVEEQNSVFKISFFFTRFFSSSYYVISGIFLYVGGGWSLVVLTILFVVVFQPFNREYKHAVHPELKVNEGSKKIGSDISSIVDQIDEVEPGENLGETEERKQEEHGEFTDGVVDTNSLPSEPTPVTSREVVPPSIRTPEDANKHTPVTTVDPRDLSVLLKELRQNHPNSLKSKPSDKRYNSSLKDEENVEEQSVSLKELESFIHFSSLNNTWNSTRSTKRGQDSSPSRHRSISSLVSSIHSRMKSSGVQELSLQRYRFSPSSINVLCDLIKISDSLTSIDFGNCGLTDDCVLKLIDAVQSNPSIRNLNLNNNCQSLESLLIIFKLVSSQELTANIQISPHSIDVSTGTIYFGTEVKHSDVISVIKAIKPNSLIKILKIQILNGPTLTGFVDLFDILSVSNSLIDLGVSSHLINISKGSFCFSPSGSIPFSVEDSSLNSLVKLPNLKELAINNCRFSPSSINVLCDLIRISDSLTSIDFGNCGLTDDCVLKLIDAVQSNPSIRNLNLNNNCQSLESLLIIFKLVSSQELTANIQISPHSIDVSTGTIEFGTEVERSDVISLFKTLRSDSLIKILKIQILNGPTLEGLVDLFEILSIKNSVIVLDISSHLINISKRSFRFSASGSISFSVEDSSLNSLVKLPNLKELTINNCRFSPSSINILCDLIRVSDSLTSIDFNNCGLTDDNVLKLINAVQSNRSIRKINLNSNSSGLFSLITLFDLISNQQLTPNIQISPHLINISTGYIACKSKVNNSDLISLLRSLKYLTCLKRVEIPKIKSPNFEEFVTLFAILSINNSVVDLDVYPHLINISNRTLCFSHSGHIPIYGEVSFPRSLVKVLGIKELTVQRCLFSPSSITVLCDFIRDSDSLTSIDFSNCGLTDECVLNLIDAIQCHCSIRSVYLNNNLLSLESLFFIFKLVLNQKLTLNIQIPPHSVDVFTGTIYVGTEVEHSDAISLFKTLNSDSLIKFLKIQSLNGLTLTGLVDLFQILSIKNSVVVLDISPHLINISKGSFCFSPSGSIPFIVEDSSLNSLVKLPNLTELAINNCRFSPSSINILCDLIRVSDSLISIDFSSCELTDDCVLKLINAVQSNHSIRKVNLSNNSFGLKSLITIFDLISTQQITSNIQVSPHSIDIHSCSISCKSSVTNSDLISLLNSLKSNSSIECVESLGLESPNFESLVNLYEILFIRNSVIDLDLSPHSIDVTSSSIIFKNRVTHFDLIALLKTLKSSVSIKCVNCFGMKSLSLLSFVTLFEVFSFSNSIFKSHLFSPHSIEIETGGFRFSPYIPTTITLKEVVALTSLLNSCNIKQFTLENCIISTDAISEFRDLIKVNSSKTSFDFRNCTPSGDVLLKEITAPENNESSQNKSGQKNTSSLDQFSVHIMQKPWNPFSLSSHKHTTAKAVNPPPTPSQLEQHQRDLDSIPKHVKAKLAELPIGFKRLELEIYLSDEEFERNLVSQETSIIPCPDGRKIG